MPGSMKRQPFNPLARRIEGADLTDSLLEPQAQAIFVPAPITTDSHGITWIGSFGLSKRGLVIDGNHTTEDEYRRFLEVIVALDDSLALIVGDYLAFGTQRQWGVTYEQVAATLKRDYGTVRNWQWVCSAVDLSLRNDKLFFEHYRAVANKNYEDQRYWLNRALEGDEKGKAWSSRRLVAEIEGTPLQTVQRGINQKFDHALDSFTNRLVAIASKASPEQRNLMAQALRQLADELEQAND